MSSMRAPSSPETQAMGMARVPPVRVSKGDAMRYQVTTPRTPREALEQALADFGPGGLGLQLTSQTNLSLVLQGGGGHIAVTAEPGAPTTLDIETREWDYGVQQCMSRVQRRRPWWQPWWRPKATATRQPASSNTSYNRSAHASLALLLQT